ncbi:OLC1v1010364C1 [Oldenlandia corymbosa var. corymbosa]|uniref:OLC1v1010364C1 n=1 Tax=Oldenlandia corymbosa var. corymbosa TaxID=529605 RepID=A0AAV1DTN9_OLDCO|nr:OLC1v1010364C1 [Oldenlandia corymbosa var. corymbosa]
MKRIRASNLEDWQSPEIQRLPSKLKSSNQVDPVNYLGTNSFSGLKPLRIQFMKRKLEGTSVSLKAVGRIHYQSVITICLQRQLQLLLKYQYALACTGAPCF